MSTKNNAERVEANSEPVEITQAAGPDELMAAGLAFATGKGGSPVDYREAHKWFSLAALKGAEAAKTYRQDMSEQLSASDLRMAQRQAREWLQAH